MGSSFADGNPARLFQQAGVSYVRLCPKEPGFHTMRLLIVVTYRLLKTVMITAKSN